MAMWVIVEKWPPLRRAGESSATYRGWWEGRDIGGVLTAFRVALLAGAGKLIGGEAPQMPN